MLVGLSRPPAAYELILVDDGSRDATLEILLDAAPRDPHMRVISLSRNFGHQIAATAGLDAARGDAVVLMDGDLQDPPELIEDFLAKFRDGYDVVYATRRRRAGESRFKLLTAALFYRMIRRLTNVSIPVDTGDFRLMSRRVVAALRSSRERHRFIRGLVSWVGFEQTGIEYDRAERFSGASKYPVSKMLSFAIDGITAFSEIPLRLATWFGFVDQRHRLFGRALRGRAAHLHRLQLARIHVDDLRHPVLGRRAAHHDRHPGRVCRPNLRRDQRPAALPGRGERRQRARRGVRLGAQHRSASPDSCARSRSTPSSSVVIGAVQPAARSRSIVATVRYWYLPRSISGMST